MDYRENPLMGWTSSADNMQGTHIWFKTKEDAIYFAEKQGYGYYVQEPNVRAFRPKQYAANFTVGFLVSCLEGNSLIEGGYSTPLGDLRLSGPSKSLYFIFLVVL